MVVHHLPRRRATTTEIPLLLMVPLLLCSNFIFEAISAFDISAEHYCGKSWADAANKCHKHCPTGEDSECSGDPKLGAGYQCFYYTGCSPKEDGDDQDEDEIELDDPTRNNYCGRTWTNAMLTCKADNKCPGGWECDANKGERCYAATGCDRPLEELVSLMTTTLAGPDTAMEDEETNIFSGVVFETIEAVALGLGIGLGQVGVEGQSVVEEIPSGSSAVDVSMVITGDYRPPPYVDLDAVAEDSINRNGAKVVNTLRERGERAGRDYFNRVEAIEAVRQEKKTERPTRSPINSPTVSPAGPPTQLPSGAPTYGPTTYPSVAPSRPVDVSLTTGGREDLQLGGHVTTSYGYIYNMRTKPDAGVVIITGFDFYTESTEEINFELWTRMGSFKEHKGTYDGWDLIASGTTKGRGIGRYTPIPEELYTPVSIPGGGGEGGTRAFYLTLDFFGLVYKLGEAGLDSDVQVSAEDDDIEVYDGEGVLFYPFPDPSVAFFYRAPRQYLGTIYYNRVPCRPFSVFGPVMDLPCPDVPTGSPTLPPPTESPIVPPTLSPSKEPIIEPTKMPTWPPTPMPVEGQTPQPIEPTNFPTAPPTVSMKPTIAPTTVEPTFAPVVPMRANIVTTLRNVPERSMTPREVEKFLEIMTLFLKRHTQSSIVLDGIDMWHQQLITVEAKEGTAVEEFKFDDKEGVEGEDDTSPQVARGAARRLQRKKKANAIPQVIAMDVTLILRISLSNLPIDLLGNMANVAIESNEQELQHLLHKEQHFYTFFRLVDGVRSRTINELTEAPTLSPTTKEYYEAKQAELEAATLAQDEEESVEEDTGVGVFVGLGIGFLWCCLTGISVAYIIGARGEMEDARDLDNLLKASRVDPNADTTDDAVSVEGGKSDKGDSTLRRTSTVPMGDEDSNDSDYGGDKNRFKLKKSASSKSLTRGASSRSLHVDEDNGDGTLRKSRRGGVEKGVSMRSMVVTSNEKKAMLYEDLNNRGVRAGDQQDSVRRQRERRNSATVAGVRRSSAELGSSDDLRSLRRSLKRDGSAGNLAGMRRSSTELGSSDDLRKLRRSLKKDGSSGDLADKRRSSALHRSASNMALQKQSRKKRDESATTLNKSDSAILRRSKNKGGSDNLASLRRSSNKNESDDKPKKSRRKSSKDTTLKKSDNDIKKSKRRESGKLSKSMVV